LACEAFCCCKGCAVCCCIEGIHTVKVQHGTYRSNSQNGQNYCKNDMTDGGPAHWQGATASASLWELGLQKCMGTLALNAGNFCQKACQHKPLYRLSTESSALHPPPTSNSS
jgi:hypothetical protein